MGIRHEKYPTEGIQFHPESIKMKPYGIKILKNFFCDNYYQKTGRISRK